MATDRYKLHQFYQGKETEPNYLNIQDITDEVYKVKELQIVTLAMDLPGKKLKQRKELEANWIAVLPTLDNVKVLSVRHRVKQDFFEAAFATGIPFSVFSRYLQLYKFLNGHLYRKLIG